MAVQASKSISLTVSATGSTMKLSANNIVYFTVSGSGSLVTFINEQDHIVTILFDESVSTINTAAVRTQAVTLTDDNSTVRYIHSDKIIQLTAVTAGTSILYWNSGKAAPDVFEVSEIPSAINTAAGNLIPITTQPTSATPSRTLYINNLFIMRLVGEDVGTEPTITFTTKVKTGTGVVTTAGTGYTNPTVAITGGGGSGATGTLTTKVVSATIQAGGTGGTPGTQTVTGTTGTGTKFQASVTVSGGGVITAILSITVAGNYTVPPSISAEPVTGASLTGATLNLSLGLLAFTVTAAGTGFTSYPTYTITDATGVSGVVTASQTVESPMTIVDGGSNLNTAPTLTFSSTTGTLATATATLNATTQTVTGTTLTVAGAYKKGTDAYPTLAITGGTGAQIKYDNKKSACIMLQVEETAATVQTAINAL